MERPDFLRSGAPARLFPVLATTSKEGRSTSILLACLGLIRELSKHLLESVGQSYGVRSSLFAFTEVVFASNDEQADRPDGLIILRQGKKQWTALIEAKIGKSKLSIEQIERYRQIARQNGIDCVITISNEFATSPQLHPLTPQLNKRLKIPVYHWSWMYILTAADYLYANESVEDADQLLLLNELRRFLSHESTGVEGFGRMPREWSDLVKIASTNGRISKSGEDAAIVADAWHQETRDLSLILTRLLDVFVTERLSRKARTDPIERRKETLQALSDRMVLTSEFIVPDAASSIEIELNLALRSIQVGMRIRAPEDRVSSKARLNWLLKQMPNDLSEDYLIRCHWPGRSEPTQYSVRDLKTDPELVNKDRAHLQVVSFDVLLLKKTGGRFAQQTNIIVDLEEAVPQFYRLIGQRLSIWKKAAPKVKAKDVSPDSIEAEADEEVWKD